jgi:hypothetical protein
LSITLAAGLCALGFLGSVQVRPGGQPAIPLDPAIPNESVLIARGLSGVPAPHQPNTPIAVDRVIADGTATYVQFHLLAPPAPHADYVPELFDNSGAFVNADGRSSALTPQWALPILARVPVSALPSWLPWRPPVVLRGVAILGALPLTAHAAVLYFQNGETVRVPLDLSALRRSRVYRGPLVRQGELAMQISTARDTGLTVDYAPLGVMRRVTLTDAHGRMVPLRLVVTDCSGPRVTGSALACRGMWAYPPQRHGTRLTLTIGAFDTTGQGALAQKMPGGPWHVSLTSP